MCMRLLCGMCVVLSATKYMRQSCLYHVYAYSLHHSMYVCYVRMYICYAFIFLYLLLHTLGEVQVTITSGTLTMALFGNLPAILMFFFFVCR